MDLFSNNVKKMAPLPDRMRPKTLEGFIRFTKKINMVETVSFKQVKDEINLMFERLLEEQEENTW